MLLFVLEDEVQDTTTSIYTAILIFQSKNLNWERFDENVLFNWPYNQNYYWLRSKSKCITEFICNASTSKLISWFYHFYFYQIFKKSNQLFFCNVPKITNHFYFYQIFEKSNLQHFFCSVSKITKPQTTSSCNFQICL